MDAGERTLLERQRDQWAEVAELSAALPSVEAESQTAGLRDTEAAQAKARAEVAWADAFAVQTAARGDIDAAEAAEDTLLTRRQAIAALVPPVGLTDLAERLDGATRAQDEAATALASAERAEDAARHLLAQEAGDPVTWTADLNRYESALTLDVGRWRGTAREVTVPAQALEAAIVGSTPAKPRWRARTAVPHRCATSPRRPACGRVCRSVTPARCARLPSPRCPRPWTLPRPTWPREGPAGRGCSQPRTPASPWAGPTPTVPARRELARRSPRNSGRRC